MYRSTLRGALRSLLALILLLPLAAAAQPAFRVDDLNTTRTDGTEQWPFNAWFAELGGIVLFTVADGIHGQELWRTDGTAGGTWLVKDICPGACPSGPQGLTAAGGRLFFIANDGVHGSELWTTDGTFAGTVMVEEIQPGLAGSAGTPLGGVGGLLLFPAGDDATGRELWVSDGTAAGTHLLADLEPGPAGSDPEPIAGDGTRIFFSATTAAEGRELWVTDGTAAGTGIVEDIRPGGDGSIFLQPPVPWARWAALSGGRLFFLADDGTHGSELWVSDGTAAGSQLVEDIEPGSESSSPFRMVAFGGGILFQARTTAEGYELWTSDGTEAGTQLVKDIYPGTDGSQIGEMTAAGAQVFFTAVDGTHGKELWRTDGTEAGTQLVEDIAPGGDDGLLVFGLASLTALGDLDDDLLFFAQDAAHGTELWKSDGTPAGTDLLADIVPGPASSYFGEAFAPDFKVVASGRWYFRVFGADVWEGLEVWSTDGTTAGTGLLKEINTQTSAFQVIYPGVVWGAFADLNGTLLFRGGDGDSNAELSRSDGTAAGTEVVKELTPGPVPSLIEELTPLGGVALFKGDDNVSGSELWATDGTAAGTSLIADLEPSPNGSPDDAPFDLTAFGDHVYFSGPNGELWRSDGAGAEGFRTDVTAANLFAWGGALYFSGSNVSDAGEPWKSDGTPGGTDLLADLHPSGGSGPSNFTPAGGFLFFSADDCVTGRELWRTDGTPEGTVLVKDVRPGIDPSILRTTYINDLGYSTPLAATSGAGATLFFLADDGVHGEELWKSDGTEAGTVLVKDVVPGARGSDIHWLTAFGDRAFFVTDDGVHGRELWMSDGTAAGTQVLDLVPGPGSSLPSDLSVQGSRLLFSAWDPLHGRELWWSDGTAAGTSLLQDIAPGVKPSSPQRFTRSGSNVYFAATDATTGFELWALPVTALGPGMAFYTVPPCRVFDTRSETPLSSETARSFQVAGACDIPVSARAIAANLTVVGGTGAGHVRVWPAGTAAPETSTLNFSAGQTRANNAVVSLGEGAMDGQASVAGGGTVQLILDVTGYFQ